VKTWNPQLLFLSKLIVLKAAGSCWLSHMGWLWYHFSALTIPFIVFHYFISATISSFASHLLIFTAVSTQSFFCLHPYHFFPWYSIIHYTHWHTSFCIVAALDLSLFLTLLYYPCLHAIVAFWSMTVTTSNNSDFTVSSASGSLKAEPKECLTGKGQVLSKGLRA